MKKIAIIVQRYGKEVNGGAEFHAKILAEKLATEHQIQILTTTALDYQGWKNHYPKGSCKVDDIDVLRFETFPLKARTMRKARRAILGKKKYFRWLRFLGLFNLADRLFNISRITEKDCRLWLSGQGPYCPNLIEYLKNNQDSYDAFIFFTYLYYPTVVGMPVVKEKAIFIPTAHDEPPLYTKPYENLFAVPKFIMYNTDSEKELVENYFKKYCTNTDIAGVGIEAYTLPDGYQPPTTLQFDCPYFVYIGRIDVNKGCDELVTYFSKFTYRHTDIKLIMIGKDFMGVEPSENIILTGFISKEDKYFLLQNSLGLIIPSKYESLSMVTLEAMACGKLPVVNGDCEVLKRHIKKSNTGFYYTDYQSFENVLEKILTIDTQTQNTLSERAKVYIKENYSWDSVLNKFRKAIDFVAS